MNQPRFFHFPNEGRCETWVEVLQKHTISFSLMILNFFIKRGLSRACQKRDERSFKLPLHTNDLEWCSRLPERQTGLLQRLPSALLVPFTMQFTSNHCYQYCNVPGSCGNSWTMTFANEEFESPINAMQNSSAVMPLAPCNLQHTSTINQLQRHADVNNWHLVNYKVESNCSTSRQECQPQVSVVIQITGRWLDSGQATDEPW